MSKTQFRDVEYERWVSESQVGQLVGFVPQVVYWVHSTRGSDTNAGTLRASPLATIDAAIGKCVANDGNVIAVMPGHAESISSATSLVPDVAGITIIGMGNGRSKPVLTFDTAVTATIDIGAANIRMTNFVFIAGMDEITLAIDVNANDFELDQCTFDYGETTGWNFRTYIDVNSFDRANIHHNELYTEPATVGAECALDMVDALNTKFENNLIMGTWDTQVILGDTTVSTLISIHKNRIFQEDTDDNGCVELTVACTGLVTDNHLGSLDGGGVTALLDGGSCLLMGNWAADAIDEAGVTKQQVTAT